MQLDTHEAAPVTTSTTGLVEEDSLTTRGLKHIVLR